MMDEANREEIEEYKLQLQGEIESVKDRVQREFDA